MRGMTTSAWGILTLLAGMIPIPILLGLIILAEGQGVSEALTMASFFGFFIFIISLLCAIFVAMSVQAVLTTLKAFKWPWVVAAGGITGGLLAYLLVQDGADPVVIPVFFAFGAYGGFWYWFGADKLANQSAALPSISDGQRSKILK